MKLDKVVPWGRNLLEYQRMFLLSDDDFQQSILGCGDGPASFNVEARQKGANVTSVDPIYQFNAEQIRQRIEQVGPDVIGQVREHQHQFIWQDFSDADDLYQQRIRAMQLFLADYALPTSASFYINAQLPQLPFEDKQFDLALCSHFLFLYSEHFDLEFHLHAMLELCRVAREVRVYPLIGLDNTPSPHLGLISKALTQRGYNLQQQPVDYQFQKGASHMLVVDTHSCPINTDKKREKYANFNDFDISR
ncbi:class I SAM-dependent methyltransferase [Methylophaga thalassica]|uniref:class I SAM-dependent methyltransferase n=1 Tax=Methylophaga aminisulfidivorans TaxID=230105 RepID=UPI0024E2699D|nr:class I SAM-dependent methyltransferase [Methylophaga aminisulfidivorans]